jgi:hypothetical protein
MRTVTQFCVHDSSLSGLFIIRKSTGSLIGFLTTPSYPSLRSRFRLHERVELAGGKAGMVLLGEI